MKITPFRFFSIAAASFVAGTVVLVPVVAKSPLSEAVAAPVAVVSARSAVVAPVARPVAPSAKPSTAPVAQKSTQGNTQATPEPSGRHIAPKNALTVPHTVANPVLSACRAPECRRNNFGQCECR